MQSSSISLFVVPGKERLLTLHNAELDPVGNMLRGVLVDSEGADQYQITNGIPRFVPPSNYADSFGYEWQVHNSTQYDSYTGVSVSADRFWKETRFGRNLSGEMILEVGCGSGRFTKHALETGAQVVAVDYSKAIDECYRTNGGSGNLVVAQASVYELPFRAGTFDKVFCFGVLQHTPDPRSAFKSLVKMLKPGGQLVADIYPKNLKYWVCNPKYWVRPLTKGRNPDQLYRLICRYINFMWPLAGLLRRIPKIGPSLNWLLLIADHSRTLKGAPDQVLKEWACLDTFDMLSPAFDKPQTQKEFRKWFTEEGLADIDVHPGYNGYEGRAVKPGAVH